MNDVAPAEPPLAATERAPRFDRLHRLYPTTAYLRRAASRRVPFFAYEFGDSGAGNDVGIAHNWAALDSLAIVPRYGALPTAPDLSCTLFGRRYGAPLGMAPIGGLSVVWPGAEQLMAAAAQARRTPYVLSIAGGATIEEIAAIAPDVAWMQMYRFWRDEHAIGLRLTDRIAAAGVDVLVLTLDVPVRTTRSREARSGLANTFDPDFRMWRQMLTRPRWLAAMARHGIPRFSMLRSLAPTGSGPNEIIAYARREMGGAFTWDELARYRERWPGHLVVKGLLHPADAERAVALGADGVWVSNHGGRQVEGLVPAVDCVADIVAAVGSRATVLLDSGIRSGLDVARGAALGAAATFAGKTFLWGLAAAGDDGARFTLDLMLDELRSTMAQIGAGSIADLARVELRRLPRS